MSLASISLHTSLSVSPMSQYEYNNIINEKLNNLLSLCLASRCEVFEVFILVFSETLGSNLFAPFVKVLHL